MKTIAMVLTDLVEQAAKELEEEVTLSVEPCVPTKNMKYGNYQSNFAFRLGKALKTNPRDIAAKIVAQLPPHPCYKKVTIMGPGYINFRLDFDWVGNYLLQQVKDKHLGVTQVGSGQTIVIDYSSPNIAKRMHIGHLRSTIIGNALHRMHKTLGYEVFADNHIGDWGTQFGKLIVGWNRWLDKDSYDEDPIAELQRLYQLFGEEAAKDDSLLVEARAETVKLQQGNTDLWEQFVEVSLQEFDHIYKRLDIEFDVVYGESFYRKMLPALTKNLLDTGIAQHSEGAVIIPFTEEDGNGLSKQPLLIQKSDGASLYGTTDLATIHFRCQKWKPSQILYVTDSRQKLHFQQVFAAAEKMIETPLLKHIPFGILRFPDGIIISSRKSSTGSVNLIDVIETAKTRAKAVVDHKINSLSEEEKDRIAEVVGIGALKYFDLSQNPQSDITFDWDRSLALNGNTAPYLLYAYARCCSILRNSGKTEFSPSEMDLQQPSEKFLALYAARTPEVILLATQMCKPNLLCEHLYRLTQKFSRFWEQCPVLDSEYTESRLSLVYATASMLQLGLKQLGISTLERM